MSMKTVTLSALATLMAVGSLSMAEAREGRNGAKFPDFSTLDANNDGQVSKEEVKAHMASIFTQADSNGDGEISTDELEAAMQARAQEHDRGQREDRIAKRAERMIDRMDEDDNGTVSQAEVMAKADERVERLFDRADKDDDGSISAAEAEEMQDRRGGKRGGHRRGGDK